MTRLTNGDIIFPNRGSPPPDLSNYVRDAGDPYLFHPAWVPCTKRTIKIEVLKGCNCSVITDICTKLDKSVSFSICKFCPVREA